MKKYLKDFSVFLVKALLIVFVFYLTVCSPAERIARITKRNPQLLEKQNIIVRDTVVFPGLNFSKPLIIRDRDTVRDTVNNTFFEYIREVDTLRINVTSKPDTIFTEKEIEVEVVKVYTKTEKVIPLWVRLLVGGLILVVVLLSLKLSGRWFDRLQTKA
jgi:hypothetical protein